MRGAGGQGGRREGELGETGAVTATSEPAGETEPPATSYTGTAATRHPMASLTTTCDGVIGQIGVTPWGDWGDVG
jgi:hypothetical protein